MNLMRRTVATAAVAGSLLAGGIAAPAFATHTPVHQDGLVNVNVGDVTILEDVRVAAAVDAVVQACDAVNVDVNQVAVLARAIAVDRSGGERTICRAETGDVTISQNS